MQVLLDIMFRGRMMTITGNPLTTFKRPEMIVWNYFARVHKPLGEQKQAAALQAFRLKRPVVPVGSTCSLRLQVGVGGARVLLSLYRCALGEACSCSLRGVFPFLQPVLLSWSVGVVKRAACFLHPPPWAWKAAFSYPLSGFLQTSFLASFPLKFVAHWSESTWLHSARAWLQLG